MNRQNSRRRKGAQVVSKAIRHRKRRDIETGELARIKGDLVKRATDEKVRTLTEVHRRTGQRITVHQQRQGSPVEDDAIGDITKLLPDETADKLFPPVTRRGFDWDKIDEFLAREFPKTSDEASAQRRLVEAIEQDTSWTLRIHDPEKVLCLECDEELIAPETYYLCDEHRKWYKTGPLTLAINRGEVTLKKFNDRRQKRFRAKWLKSAYVADWDANNAPRRKRNGNGKGPTG